MTLDEEFAMTLDQVFLGGPYPEAAVVVDGENTGDPGVTGTYPTTATTQAADRALVDAAKADILNTRTITIGGTGVTGTLVNGGVATMAVARGTPQATPDCSGTYTPNGTINGFPSYALGTSWYSFWNGIDGWVIADQPDETATNAWWCLTQQGEYTPIVGGSGNPTVAMTNADATYPSPSVVLYNEVFGDGRVGTVSLPHASDDPPTATIDAASDALVASGAKYGIVGAERTGGFTHVVADYVAKTDVVAAAWVTTGHDNYTGGSAGEYPLSATSFGLGLADQLAADVLAAQNAFADPLDPTADTFSVTLGATTITADTATWEAARNTDPGIANVLRPADDGPTDYMIYGDTLVGTLEAGSGTPDPTNGPNAPVNLCDAYYTVDKGFSPRLYMRVIDGDATALTQAEVASAKYTIYALDSTDEDTRTPVSGHTAVSLTVNSVLWDTLQSNELASNWNFFLQPLIATHDAFTDVGTVYLVEVTFTRATTAERVPARFRVRCV